MKKITCIGIAKQFSVDDKLTLKKRYISSDFKRFQKYQKKKNNKIK